LRRSGRPQGRWLRLAAAGCGWLRLAAPLAALEPHVPDRLGREEEFYLR